MTGEGDHVLLLGEDSTSTSVPPPQPRKIRLQIAAIASIAGVVAVVAWRRSFAAPASEHSLLEDVISEDELMSMPRRNNGGWVNSAACTSVGIDDTYMEAGEVKNKFWPHRYDDLNWKDHCSKDVKSREDCVSRLIEKYVGDYFDKVLVGIKKGDADYDWLPQHNNRETQRWKERVIKSMQDQSKYLKRIEDPKNAPLEWAQLNIASVDPGFPSSADPCAQSGAKCTQNGWICDAMISQRPISAKNVNDCGPNYNAWETVARYFTTQVPAQIICENDAVTACLSEESTLTPAQKTDAYKQPGTHDLTNEKLAACKHLLQPLKNEDWISATLTALDVRECIASDGQKPKSPYSRAWVRNCLPGRADNSKVDEPRIVGWPGFVLSFISEYGVAESECVKDYDGDLETRGHCPATCEDGTSLAGNLRSYSTLKDYTLIYNGQAPNNKYLDMKDAQMEFARYSIWKYGPLVGMVEQTLELVDCTRNDAQVLYSDQGCDDDATWIATGKPLFNMASVTVYGWGEVAGAEYWSFVSGWQTEGRMLTCGVKMFIVPKIEEKAIETDFYDKSLSAFRAEAVCNRGEGFCTQEGAGYTATEDCDGDGVLDHWCYLAGNPTYEAFISSRDDCTVQEKPCRRSVLPGRTFGCQRPLGWCMNGESYKRNVDCDGDGHFDHVCEKFGHAGFISSSQDCIDTWEEGTAGRKCDMKTLVDQDASITYKLVHDAGDCVSHGSQCFQSHAEWPKENYKPLSNCKFHIEATNHQPPMKNEADCEKTPELENQLLLEVLYEDTEKPVYDLSGSFYGDKLALNTVLISPEPNGKSDPCVAAGTCIDWRPVLENIHSVYDGSIVEFSSDSSVEREGWLVCLRERSKIPEIYTAKCSEIGDDVWAKLMNVRKKNTYVSVECDMAKCRKALVKTVSDDNSERFYRTTNLCDAGWQVARGDKFDVEFSSPQSFDGGEMTESTFSVLLA